MNCDQLREWLFAEHLDAAADEKVQSVIDEHLHQCAACESLARELKESVSDPFKGARELTPSSEVWAKIKSEIDPPAPQVQLKPQLSTWDYVVSFFNLKTLSFVVPVFAIVAFTLFSPIKQSSPGSLDAARYLQTTFSAEDGEFSGFSNEGFGSTIEEFLL